PSVTLFPYTTLFRSHRNRPAAPPQVCPPPTVVRGARWGKEHPLGDEASPEQKDRPEQGVLRVQPARPLRSRHPLPARDAPLRAAPGPAGRSPPAAAVAVKSAPVGCAGARSVPIAGAAPARGSAPVEAWMG